jgi:hypothetical protein
MRVFLVSVAAIITIAVGAYLGLNLVQKHAEIAFATQGARVDPTESPGG